MKKLLYAFALIMLLTGCKQADVVEPNVNPKPEVSPILATVAKDSLFSMNQTCKKSQAEVEKHIAELKKEYGQGVEEWVLEEIFYSPKTNSCLYVRYIENEVANAGDIPDINFRKSLYEVGKDAGHITPLEGCISFKDRTGNIKKRYENSDLLNLDTYSRVLYECDQFDEKIKEYKAVE